MGKDTDAVAMEIDNEKSDPPNPKFSINVLQLLKSAQMQHGLRHGDYTRYRRYCTARLRRLYKSLKFTHGRGKYTQRVISENTVTDVRYLHIILYTAERAWSHAMEKRQLPDGPNKKQRIYLIGRLRKAVKWATLFSQLCALKGDSRTSLEAEAYASYMKGSLLFEQDQNWDTALRNFKSARAVYEELGKYGDLDNQLLCRERVEELEPSIRYCLHKIGNSNLQASELLKSDMEGPALDLFRAKLEAVMAEARSQQAATLTEFNWLGRRFPVSNAKTRVSILKAQELEKDVHGQAAESLPAEKRLTIFDKIFTAYHDARSCIRNDLVAAGSAENVKDDLNGLDKAICAVLDQRTIERNLLLVSIAKSKLNRQHDKNEKATKPEELVRLYDLLLQNIDHLSDLVTSTRDRKPEEEEFAAECAVKKIAFRAERCFYQAKSYSLSGQRDKAYLLYSRALSLADSAIKESKNNTNFDQKLVEQMRTLCTNSRSNICIERAKGVAEKYEREDPEKLSKKMATVSLTEAEKKKEKFLLDNLGAYEPAVGAANSKTPARITPFPPAMVSIPRNPIVLDLAYNLIDFPSIDHRMKQERKGFISRIWG